MQKFYYYGSQCKDFEFSTQPLKGILWREDDAEKHFSNVFVYSRQLTDEELKDYKLHFIKCE